MHVAEVLRYPVKSMAGEPLEEAFITRLGIDGDRIVHVVQASGRVVTARTHPRLLGHKATLGPGREPLVDGRPWTDPSVLADVRRIVGPGARLVRDEGPERFDVLPLLVATDGAIRAFGYDSRRLRPNVIVAGVSGLDERNWPGRCLCVGEVVIALADLRGHCVMTTFNPDTLEQDPQVLKTIVKRFGGRLALNALPIRGGVLHRGDPVEIVAADACRASARGHLSPFL